MNRLLKLTAIIEAATGLGLVAVPALIVRLLLGGEISGALPGWRYSHWASPVGSRVTTFETGPREG